MRIMNKLKDTSGAALVFVVGVMVVVFIMISIVASISQANIKQAGAQENSIKAFYIARSGVELAYETLLTSTPSLLNEFVAAPNNSKVLEQHNIDFQDGTADVRITSSGTDDTQKILITSTGTLKDTGMSRTVTLEFYINYRDHPDMEWTN